LAEGELLVVVVVGLVVVVWPGARLPPPEGVEFDVDVDVVVVALDRVVEVVVGVVVAVEVVGIVVVALAVVGVADVSVVGVIGVEAEDVLWLLPPHPARASAPSSTPRTSFLMAYLLSGAPAESSV
jgi:hypothetical protein